MTSDKPDIGLRQARKLCQLTQQDRIAFIAEGLPVILESAQGFWNASLQLKENPREAAVLEGSAREEAAKILILVDAVRCPTSNIVARLGKICGWFYDHLARLIYADAVSWKPMHVQQLQEYVDTHRKMHFLEGEYGEYILPNWSLYERESRLYADIERTEDGSLTWSELNVHAGFLTQHMPRALQTAEALAALGIFSVQGLKLMNEIWSQILFTKSESHGDAERLTKELLERIILEKLPTERAEQSHVSLLYNQWQLPMYDLDLSPINVPLSQLKALQEARFYSEFGDI